VMLPWPVVKPNQWRSPAGTLSRPATWLGFTSAGRTGPREPGRALDG
jgi:hypothetical protein